MSLDLSSGKSYYIIFLLYKRNILRGGYNITPRSIEFWQGQTDRIHDRIKFKQPREGDMVDNKYTFQGENNWIYERLCP